jgi:hypothetical protein
MMSQRPDNSSNGRPREGSLFKREWFSNPVKRVPYEKLNLVRAWDLASASDPSNDPDYTVGLLMGSDRDTHMLYIINVIRGRFSPGERQQKISSTAVLDGTICHIQHPTRPGQCWQVRGASPGRPIARLSGFERARTGEQRESRNGSMASSSWLRRHGTGTLSTNYVRSRMGHMMIRSMRRRLLFVHWFAGLVSRPSACHLDSTH